MSLDANAFADGKSSHDHGQGGSGVLFNTLAIAVAGFVAVVAQSISLAADNTSAAPVSGGVPAVATTKPTAEVEKWFAQVDGPQEEAFQKQVLKPYQAGVAELRARYLASLDAALTKSSAAGQLKEALSWRTERQAFEKAQNVAADDATTPAYPSDPAHPALAPHAQG